MIFSQGLETSHTRRHNLTGDATREHRLTGNHTTKIAQPNQKIK